MKGQPSISSIYRLGTPDEQEDPLRQWGRIEAMRRRAWRMCGVIAVTLSELPPDLETQLRQWAEDRYGKR